MREIPGKSGRVGNSAVSIFLEKHLANHPYISFFHLLVNGFTVIKMVLLLYNIINTELLEGCGALLNSYTGILYVIQSKLEINFLEATHSKD